MDNCPTCGKRILDWDEKGCEAPSGQRYCLVHLPSEVASEMGLTDEVEALKAQVAYRPPTYDELCEKAAYSQGVGQLRDALKSAGIDSTIEQTGGFCMVGYIHGEDAEGNRNRRSLSYDYESLIINFSEDNEDAELNVGEDFEMLLEMVSDDEVAPEDLVEKFIATVKANLPRIAGPKLALKNDDWRFEACLNCHQNALDGGERECLENTSWGVPCGYWHIPCGEFGEFAGFGPDRKQEVVWCASCDPEGDDGEFTHETDIYKGLWFDGRGWVPQHKVATTPVIYFDGVCHHCGALVAPKVAR
jgi:hypothetical protein